MWGELVQPARTGVAGSCRFRGVRTQGKISGLHPARILLVSDCLRKGDAAVLTVGFPPLPPCGQDHFFCRGRFHPERSPGPWSFRVEPTLSPAGGCLSAGDGDAHPRHAPVDELQLPRRPPRDVDHPAAQRTGRGRRWSASPTGHWQDSRTVTLVPNGSLRWAAVIFSGSAIAPARRAAAQLVPGRTAALGRGQCRCR